MWGQMFAEIGKGIQQDYTNLYSARQAEENQRRQIRATERQYKNRYQWMMRDLKAAGLNPILAGNLGGGSMSAAGAASGVSGVSGVSSIGSARAANRIAKKQEQLLESEIEAQIAAAYRDRNIGYLNKENATSAKMMNWRTASQNQLWKDHPWLMHMELSPTGVSTALGAMNQAKELFKIFKHKPPKPVKPISETFKSTTSKGRPYEKTTHY